MTEEELRQIVRRVVVERLGASPASTGQGSQAPLPPPDIRTHASHATFRVPAGSEMGGPCVIEPQVSCEHCGYCRSMGH